MKKTFKGALFGYKKSEVDKYIQDIIDDYQKELTRKKDRMLELNDQNRDYRGQLEDLEHKVSDYMEQEAYISKALVNAQQKAQDIIDNGHKKVSEERYKLEVERVKWETRSKEVRNQLLDLEKKVCCVLENFRSEVNYIVSQELSETILQRSDETAEIEGQSDEKIKNVS